MRALYYVKPKVGLLPLYLPFARSEFSQLADFINFAVGSTQRNKWRALKRKLSVYVGSLQPLGIDFGPALGVFIQPRSSYKLNPFPYTDESCSSTTPPPIYIYMK